MKLNYEQIKEITQGAVNIFENDGKFTFHRFNKEEEEYYSKTSHAQKIFSTAGIQMIFKTDADSLSLKGCTNGSTGRTYFSFDVFGDGELLQARGLEAYEHYMEA